jgi:hypothetical protein
MTENLKLEIDSLFKAFANQMESVYQKQLLVSENLEKAVARKEDERKKQLVELEVEKKRLYDEVQKYSILITQQDQKNKELQNMISEYSSKNNLLAKEIKDAVVSREAAQDLEQRNAEQLKRNQKIEHGMNDKLAHLQNDEKSIIQSFSEIHRREAELKKREQYLDKREYDIAKSEESRLQKMEDIIMREKRLTIERANNANKTVLQS